MQAFHILWAALLLLSQAAAAQAFRYQADLEEVPADSFYRILLAPAITAYLQPGFPDIRLYDGQKREVPYLLLRAEPGAGGQDSLLPVSRLAFRQYDSLEVKKTILRFSAPAPVLIDQLAFTITAPALYHRQAVLYQKREPRRRRGRDRSSRHYQPVARFVLAAGKPNTLRLSGFRSADFYVAIRNGDNLPLVIREVAAYQQPAYLVAALVKGKKYHLAFGSAASMLPPAYDLPYFKDKIPRQLPTLKPGEMKLAAGQEQQNGHPLNAFFTSRALIWAALLAVIAFLGFMTYKMLQEGGGKKQDRSK
jgi:hypothetical protein